MKHYELPKPLVWGAAIAFVASLVTNCGTILKPAVDWGIFKKGVETKMEMIADAEASTSASLVAHEREDQEKEVKLANTLGRIEQKVDNIASNQASMWQVMNKRNANAGTWEPAR